MNKQEPSPIVVVDDDPEYLYLVIKTLTRAGYRCLGFTSARNAFTHIIQSPVDLVITDIYMPEMDGFEMLRSLRRTRRNVPVITVSGEGRMTKGFDLDCARKLGAVAVLRKPFDPDALTAIVARYVGHSANKTASNTVLQTEQQPHFEETKNAKT
jgi:DNA-binding NtrC family response regulator